MAQDTNSEFYIQKDKKRGKRLHQKNKVRKKTKERLTTKWGNYYVPYEYLDERVIGIESETPHRCSGPCCGNPRKHFSQITLKEIQALHNYQSQIEDLFFEDIDENNDK